MLLCSLRMEQLLCLLRMEQLLRSDSIDPADIQDAIEPTEKIDPRDPTEAIEPMLPMDSTDPFEQIERNEFSDRQDNIGEVEPVEGHDLVPGRHEVADELLRRVTGRVDLGDRPELGVRAEDEVDRGGGPPDVVRAAGPPS